MNGGSSTKASNCGTTQRATCALEVTSHAAMTSRYEARQRHRQGNKKDARPQRWLHNGHAQGRSKVTRHKHGMRRAGKAWFRHTSLSLSQETRVRTAGAGRIHARIVRECRAHGPLLPNRNASAADGRWSHTVDAPASDCGAGRMVHFGSRSPQNDRNTALNRRLGF